MVYQPHALDLSPLLAQCVRGCYLVLLYRGVVFVTHGTDFHSLIPLSIPLGEELHHDAVRPLPVKPQRFGGVAQVSTVDHVLQNLQREMLTVRHTPCFVSVSDMPLFFCF